MALSQLFWDVLMPWNLKSTYFSLKMIHFLSLNIWYVIYVVFWIKYWNWKLPHHCILFLFTICTVSQLFWNRVCRWMTILDAVPPEGSEITVVQLRLAPLSFTHWNSSRFLESFNYVMHCWRWNIQISSYLSLRNIVFKHFNNFLTYLLANWRSSAHLCS